MNSSNSRLESNPSQPFGPNDVLTTNNLINEASLAATGQRLDVGLLFDMSSLIEAVVLHDHILCLESPVPPQYDALPLRQLLLQEGILKSFAPTMKDHELREDMERLTGRSFALELQKDIEGLTEASTKDASSSSALLRPKTYDGFDFPTMCSLENMKFAGSLPKYFETLVELWTEDEVWASQPANSYLERTLRYWIVSDRSGVSLYPDLSRLPLIMHVTNNLRQSLTQESYRVIAKAFSTSIKDLSRSNAPFRIPLPPLTALLLTRASSPEDIGPILLELRKEFDNLRKIYREYEQVIRAPETTLGEQSRAREELHKINSLLKKAYEIPDSRVIQEAVPYLETLGKAVVNPFSSEAISGELVLKPMEWIREWWLRRRAIHLFDIKKKLDSISAYGSLVSKVFKVDLDEKTVSVQPSHLANIR